MGKREEEPVLSDQEYGFLFSIRFPVPVLGTGKMMAYSARDAQEPGHSWGDSLEKLPTNSAEEPEHFGNHLKSGK
jgi:hypothetical protein